MVKKLQKNYFNLKYWLKSFKKTAHFKETGKLGLQQTHGLVSEGVEARRISAAINRMANAVCIDMCHSCTAAK